MAATTQPSPVGQPLSRVDGRLKVTGRATYAVEGPVKDVTHGVIVQSTISSGTIESLDVSAAEKADGVIAVVTPDNITKLNFPKNDVFHGGMMGELRQPLSDKRIYYAGQHLAVVVADTIEHARYAASLVKVTYQAQQGINHLNDDRARIEMPAEHFGNPLQIHRGKLDEALRATNLTKIEASYHIPTETHNPMELSGTIAAWDGDRLTVWDATQYIMGVRATLADTFGVPRENVRVLCPFVGGAFGCKGAQWPHTILTAAVARMVKRPVKLSLTRQQMFTSCGHRPELEQNMMLAATSDGKLVGLKHETIMHSSMFGGYVEPCGATTSRMLYEVPNAEITHIVRQINVATPTFMRAPGECPGSFALECAMDELAHALKMDPVQLRLVNHAEADPDTKKPFSAKHLKECYETGAEKFGWSKRVMSPGSMRNDRGQLVGWGMATALYPGNRWPSSARVRLIKDGADVRVIGSAATHDLGTGAYTVFTQITAQSVGVPVSKVKFELGDSLLPYAPVAGGSNTTASVGQAIWDAAVALKLRLLEIAGDQSPLAHVPPDQIDFVGGKLVSKSDPSRSESLADLLARSGRAELEGVAIPPGPQTTQPAMPLVCSSAYYNSIQTKYDFHSFGAHFVEVLVDDFVPRLTVSRVVSVMNIGSVINPKTAGSQVLGGVTMGIGMAKLEESVYDLRDGRCVTDNLADYAVPVNPDVPNIEVHFIDIPDPNLNAMGSRGVGEIGITGIAAAIANAVFHATGKRMRDLPITLEKLLA